VLNTFDRTLWQEDMVEDWRRRGLTTTSPEPEIRRLFPFKALVLTPCLAYNIKKGEIIPFARTRHEVSIYPIEAAMPSSYPGSVMRIMAFNSTEVQLLEV
jgi:hypothetical protein